MTEKEWKDWQWDTSPTTIVAHLTDSDKQLLTCALRCFGVNYGSDSAKKCNIPISQIEAKLNTLATKLGINLKEEAK